MRGVRIPHALKIEVLVVETRIHFHGKILGDDDWRDGDFEVVCCKHGDDGTEQCASCVLVFFTCRYVVTLSFWDQLPVAGHLSFLGSALTFCKVTPTRSSHKPATTKQIDIPSGNPAKKKKKLMNHNIGFTHRVSEFLCLLVPSSLCEP